MAAGGRSLNQFLVKVILLWLLVDGTFFQQSRMPSSEVNGVSWHRASTAGKQNQPLRHGKCILELTPLFQGQSKVAWLFKMMVVDLLVQESNKISLSLN